ncbi:MAG TPA: hypothetical protein VFZ41_01635 [Solirubrobacterales bacterium]
MTALLAFGCGAENDEAPGGCLEGESAYLDALRDAPGRVRLAGETPISGCLAENQGGGELAIVGAAMVKAATRLNGEARTDPGGPAPLRLGYLLGAADRGAERTGGIHADLIRRLEAAALYNPGVRPLPPAFERAYRRGFEAGFARG